ncbi:MAG: hypothetical protein JRH20_27195 [Deltaproteobacteria bacterium]|nr:hypothetical protein [Deltaproteobacteria bacterium]
MSSDPQIEQVSALCGDCGAPLSFALGTVQTTCGFCNAGMVMGEQARVVRLRCPACSGNFYYIDGKMGGQCPYCETPLVMLTRDRLLRFIIRPASEPPTPAAEMIFVPFWHLTGLIYGWDFGSRVSTQLERGVGPKGENQAPERVSRDHGPQKIFRGRVVDRWLADPSGRALGLHSLRWRGAIHPLEPLTAEHEQLGHLLPIYLPVEEARGALQDMAMGAGATDGITKLACQRADLVAQTLSLLYYPFWRVDGELFDGVNGDQETLLTPTDAPSSSPTSGFDELSIVELRCKGCGERLSPSSGALVFPCHKCDTFWVAGRDGLAPFSAAYAEPRLSAEDAPVVWLPFWRVETTLHMAAKTSRCVGDLRNALGVRSLSGEGGSDPDDALCYFVPAYGAMRAPRLDFAARDLTRMLPRLRAGRYTGGDNFACFFGPDDARRLGYVVWLQILSGTPRRIASLRVETGDVALWYVPFADLGRELHNLLTGARYDRAAFRGVSH